jgi:hypothetical protein
MQIFNRPRPRPIPLCDPLLPLLGQCLEIVFFVANFNRPGLMHIPLCDSLRLSPASAVKGLGCGSLYVCAVCFDFDD